MKRLAPRSTALFVATLLLLPALSVGSTAFASRPGSAGPPRYPSFPFNDRLGSGGPPPFLQCVGDPLPDGCGTDADERRWVWKIDEMTYGASGYITFYDFRNAITQSRSEPMSGPA